MDGYLLKFALVGFILISTNAQLNIPMELQSEPNTGRPGVRARLSQKGVNYVAGVLANSLITEIAIANIALEPSALDKQAADLLDGLICARIGFIVDDRFNDRFSLLPTKITLAQVGENQVLQDLKERMQARRQRSVQKARVARAARIPQIVWPMGATMPRRTLMMNQQNSMMMPISRMGMGNFRPMNRKRVSKREAFSNVDSLFLDYTLFTDPKADSLGFIFESSGEVSLRGRGGTPFGPVAVELPDTSNEEFMLQMAVSDFVPNSLMYHGHTIGLFNARIDPKTPHFGSLMRTTCTMNSGLLFCLGDIFPTLRRLHPNHHLVLFFNTLQAPVIRFKSPSAGGITFRLNGRIVVLIIDNANPTLETQVAEMSLDINAHMKMRLVNGSVRPKIILDSMKLTTLSPGVLLQDELDDAVMLAREVLQRIANEVLKDGFPVPVHPIFKLNKPKVRILERTMLLQANIELNERLLRQLTAPDILAIPNGLNKSA